MIRPTNQGACLNVSSLRDAGADDSRVTSSSRKFVGILEPPGVLVWAGELEMEANSRRYPCRLARTSRGIKREGARSRERSTEVRQARQFSESLQESRKASLYTRVIRPHLTRSSPFPSQGSPRATPSAPALRRSGTSLKM